MPAKKTQSNPDNKSPDNKSDIKEQEPGKYKHSAYTLHIFRRDYRLVDNTALNLASKNSDSVIPAFFFTHKQIRDNKLKSDNCVQFLVESLKDLSEEINKQGSKLNIFYGDEFEQLDKILHDNPEIGSISFNRDYTKYAAERDAKIAALAEKHNRQVITADDITLHPVGTIKTTTGKTYTKYTPFMRACLAKPIAEPDGYHVRNLAKSTAKLDLPTQFTKLDTLYVHNAKLPERGGRERGLQILAEITRKHRWRDYNLQRDQLSYLTTHLSPFNKFGCVSVREVYWAFRKGLGPSNGLLQQLAWRDFFYNLSAENPVIYDLSAEGGALNPKWRDIKWENDTTKWKAWKEGRTGYPVVDACMREINTTGYMHNRGRLIVSNFLCRLLHVDWRWGEHYFAQQLYDYDPAQNSFGWQLNAFVSGTESRPLNQTILNPWIQSAKYDREAEYIKHWLPELKDVPAAHLHRWDEFAADHIAAGVDYIKPIIDYTTEKAHNLDIYKKSLKS